MPLVSIKVVEGVFTEKQKHDLAAKITDAAMKRFGSCSRASKRPSIRWASSTRD